MNTNKIFQSITIIALGIGTALAIMAITASLPVEQPGLRPYDFKLKFDLRRFCEREGIDYQEVTK